MCPKQGIQLHTLPLSVLRDSSADLHKLHNEYGASLHYTDTLPWYNFLFTLFYVLCNYFDLKDFENWKIKKPEFFLQVAGGTKARQMQKKCCFSEPEERLQKITHIIISTDWPPANIVHFIGWFGQGLLCLIQLFRRHMIRQASLKRNAE